MPDTHAQGGGNSAAIIAEITSPSIAEVVRASPVPGNTESVISRCQDRLLTGAEGAVADASSNHGGRPDIAIAMCRRRSVRRA